MTDSGDGLRDQFRRDTALLEKWQIVAYPARRHGVAIDDRLDWCLAALVGRDAADGTAAAILGYVDEDAVAAAAQ